VIKALLLREMITLWGRRNIGFLWVLFEPLVIIFVITMVVYIVKSYSGGETFRLFGVDLLAFLVTGYSISTLWRRTPIRMSAAITANKGLLVHRNVKPFDLYMSRYILEVVGVTLSFIIMMVGFVSFDIMPAPASYELMVAAWILMMWFTFEEPFYVIKWNFCLTLLGLYTVRSKIFLNRHS
jgi:ABC-type polysaccharide/polyol phosphate export permease